MKVHFGDISWYDGWELGAKGGSSVYFYGWKNGKASYCYISGGTVPVYCWNHIAFVKNGSVNSIYLNGVNVGSNTVDLSSLNPNSKLYIGCSYDPNLGGTVRYSKGYIDELCITKGIARWTSNFSPPSSEYTYDRGPLINPISPSQNGTLFLKIKTNE
jgi:hypothetical protein